MEIPRHWRLKKQRYSLEGTEYPCGHVDLAGAPVCRQCVTEKIERDSKRIENRSKLPGFFLRKKDEVEANS